MQYGIVESETVEQLVGLVNKALADGWTCMGGLVYEGSKNFRDKSRFFQAMTKAEISKDTMTPRPKLKK